MNQNTSLIQKKSFIIKIRLSGYHFFVLWLYILRSLVKNKNSHLQGNIKGLNKIREQIIQQNERIQREYRDIFCRFNQVCGECGGGCCYGHKDIPYDEIDVLIYGLPEEKLDRKIETFNKYDKAYKIKNVINKLIGREKRNLFDVSSGKSVNVQSKIPSVCLGEHGCLLPYGERVAGCTLYICKTLAARMTWKEYAYYFCHSTKYLWHLTKAAMKLTNLNPKGFVDEPD